MGEQGLFAVARQMMLVCALAVAGCGNSAPASRSDLSSPVPDLSQASETDLQLVPDLAPAADLAPASDLAGPVIVSQLAGVTVSTLAGSATAGSQDGTGAAAQFTNPVGVAIDGSGNLFVTEYEGSRVRRVTPDGATTLLTSQANFWRPFALALDGVGGLVVQTDWDDTGAKSATSGTLWTIPVGTGAATVIVGGLGRPRGLGSLSIGSIAVSDESLDTLSLLDPASGVLTPVASTGLNVPIGVAALPDGSFVVADSGNHCLKRVSGDQVELFAGDGNAGMIDGPALTARFDRPIALAADLAGNLYVSDQGNHRIRRVNPSGVVETIAGDGVMGFADGSGEQAEFYGQEGLAVDPAGGLLYVADGNNGDGSAYHRIRQIAF